MLLTLRTELEIEINGIVSLPTKIIKFIINRFIPYRQKEP